MALKGAYYDINGCGVTPPDEVLWKSVTQGTDLTAREKRSPYRELQWTRQVVGPEMEELTTGQLDWFAFDNTTLTTLKTTIPNAGNMYTVYTDAICQSVVSRQRGPVQFQVVATFLVNTDSELPEMVP